GLSPVPAPLYIPQLAIYNLNHNRYWPPVMFDCSIAFTIYCAEKTKRNTTNWVAICQLSDLSVTFIANEPLNWPGFQNLVANQCNTDYNYICRMPLLHPTSLQGMKVEPLLRLEMRILPILSSSSFRPSNNLAVPVQ
ncbi:hypothetical protein VP01_13550g1, partial [Puccinia sorghi]